MTISLEAAPPAKKSSIFMTTQWSLIAMAVEAPGKNQMAALEELCCHYRPAVVAYLNKVTWNSQDVEDLTQQFFIHLLSKNTLEKADLTKGRFRSFLLTCLKNHVANEFQKRKSFRRGGEASFANYEDQELESGQDLPDRAFDRKWAETVLQQALAQVEADWKKQTKPFEQLKEYLLAPKGATPILEKARELNISPAALKSSIYRLRQSYGVAVRAVISQTLTEHQNVEEELESLLRILAG